MTQEFKRRKEVEATAQHIKSLGFIVYLTKEPNHTYGYYTDGLNVAYFQQNEFAPGVNIATCNKTPGSFGAHHILEPDNVPVSIAQLTKDYLQQGFAMYPKYYNKEARNYMPVIKYASLEEFLASEFARSLKEV